MYFVSFLSFFWIEIHGRWEVHKNNNELFPHSLSQELFTVYSETPDVHVLGTLEYKLLIFNELMN